MLDPAMPGAVPCPAAWWPLPSGVAGHKAGLVQGHLGCSCLLPAPKGWDTPPLQDQDPPRGGIWDVLREKLCSDISNVRETRL